MWRRVQRPEPGDLCGAGRWPVWLPASGRPDERITRAGASLPGALIGRLATSRRGMLAAALASSLLIGLLALQILSP